MRLIQAKWIVCIAVLAALVSTAAAQDAPQIEFEKYELPNGLDVILHEDHSIPVVAVNVWYHVGSKNEKPGRTGFAHLFEHMMFQGSEHYDDDYFKPLKKIGGSVSGSTYLDYTNYWENVPSNYLELALWLESDRMGFLLPAMTQERLDNQRDVVKNERRQRYENQPYGKAYEIITSMLPGDHPYSWPVIGSMEDLSAASLEDVSEFFRTYYTPNNASLCIAGDFEPSLAKELVEKYFASIPPGPPVDRLSSWVPELDGVKRAVAEDNVKLPRLYCVWPTPAQFAPGDAELFLLAVIFSIGKTSRLYQTLVYEQQIAQDVSPFLRRSELVSFFGAVVTAREGHTLEEMESAMDAELERILTEGVTPEELAQAQIAFETQFVINLQQIGGLGGKADVLNRYNTFLGDPGRFQWNMERYARATAADIQRYARQYLHPDRRLILHVVPQGDLAAAKTEPDRSVQPSHTPEPSFTPPEIQRSQLSNGLQLMLVEDHRLPLIRASVAVKGGWATDPADMPGVASLTAELLDEGTSSRTALQISEEARRLGARLESSSFFDGSSARINFVLKKNIDPALELLADIVLNPTFPEQELERQRKIYQGDIQQESKEPVTVALKTYLRMLYGSGHPYAQPYGSGTEESIKAITRQDLVSCYEANYLPNNAAVVMVGDITLDEAQEKLERVFGTWKPGTVVQSQVADPSPITSTRIYIVDKPGAAQSVIFCGGTGIRRSDPNYAACQVVNDAFGGKYTSRLFMNLREDKGYTYGIRSDFEDRRGLGPFYCSTQVQTAVTRESIVEIVREIRDIVNSRPLTDDELTDSKNQLIKLFPQQFQTYPGIASQMGNMFIFGLPDDELDTYVSRINSVDAAMANQVIKNYFHPDALLIVVVGDRKEIEPGVRELGLGEILFVDAQGNPVE